MPLFTDKFLMDGIDAENEAEREAEKRRLEAEIRRQERWEIFAFIAVALIVVALIGGAIWFFWFRGSGEKSGGGQTDKAAIAMFSYTLPKSEALCLSVGTCRRIGHGSGRHSSLYP